VTRLKRSWLLAYKGRARQIALIMSARDRAQLRAPLLREPDRDGRSNVAEIQRVRMLRAALEAIDVHGYSGFTVAHVIQRAKVSRKTFYEVFIDREDCFAALFEQAIAEASSRVIGAYEAHDSWRERTRAALAELLAFIDDEPALARLCFVDALAAGPRVHERRAGVLDRVRAVIELGGSQRDGVREPAEVTAEGVMGAVFAVIHTRLVERNKKPYVELLGQLMSIVVLPYLGRAAAARELARPIPARRSPAKRRVPTAGNDPLEGVNMRLTYRTVRVLSAIAASPGASNREVADASGISDQGQISKLLARLERLELIENLGSRQPRGAPNRWCLTDRGQRVELSTRRP
jgi:AcrR family transcriptional regulator